MASSSKRSTASLMKPNTIKQEPNRGGISPHVRIKSEPNLDCKPLPTERLSSFRLPRDLTLGGLPPPRSIVRPNLGASTSNKKVYTPNLNAVRNKNVDVKTSRDTTNLNNKGRGRGARADRGTRGARGTNRGAATGATTSRNTVVASTGLFSEGAGDGTSKRLLSRFRSSDNGESSSSTLRRPTINKKERPDPVLEQKHMNEIYDLDDDPVEDESLANDHFTPINLMEVKPEVKLENRINGLDIKDETIRPNSKKVPYPASIEAFFQRQTEQMFLLQLPDTLPGHGPIQEPAESAEHERPMSPDPESMYCTMEQLDEGLIGRLVRYRSGKTKLILGESKFDIDLGIEPGLLQEVISLTTNSAERSGNMINLGQIGAKFNAIPDWEYMLQKDNNRTS